MEAQRNHRHMEQRQAARLTRAAPPIKELLMPPRLAMNQRNLFTSRDHSFFHKSLSTQALHPSLALQETTVRPHNQEAGFGQREASPVSVLPLSGPKEFFSYFFAMQSLSCLALESRYPSCKME